METIVRLRKKLLKRVLNSGRLFAIGYGDVGSSIYYTLGATALFALGATPLALLLAGLVFLCTGLTYAELSSTFPGSGGSSAFARRAFNDLISFVAGWALLLDYIVTLAISSFSIYPYFQHVLRFVGMQGYHTPAAHLGWTICVIAFLCLINIVGIRSSGRMSLMLAIFTVATQFGIVLLGALLFLNLPFVWQHLKVGVAGAVWSPDWPSFLKGCAMAMVAYTGIEAITQLSEETDRPETSIPKAIRWTMGVVLLLYIGIATVGLSVISPQELGTTYLDDPIGGIVLHFPIGGKWLAPWVGLIAGCVLFICANAGLIGCSRLVFSMGEYGQLPRFFYKTHSRFRTPYVSLLIFSLLAVGVVLWSRGVMLFLVDLYNFGAQIAFFFAHLSLLVLRFRESDKPRPAKAPFNIKVSSKVTLPLTALLGCLASLAVWLLVVWTKPEGRLFGLAWLVVGLVVFGYYRKKRNISPLARSSIETIYIPTYKEAKYHHILVWTRLKGGVGSMQTALELARAHKAKVTVVYVMQIHESIPIEANLGWREKAAEAALKRAGAVAEEYAIDVRSELVRARFPAEALGALTKELGNDLLVIGAKFDEIQEQGTVLTDVEKLLRTASCSVIICRD